MGNGITDWKTYHRDALGKLHPDIRRKAVDFLRTHLTEEIKVQIREAESKNPQTWWARYHLSWGMAVRNTLRTNGFSENELGVENLDNVYVGLVEAALLVEEPPKWTPGRHFI